MVLFLNSKYVYLEAGYGVLFRLTQAFGKLEIDHSLHQGNVSSKLSFTACVEAKES